MLREITGTVEEMCIFAEYEFMYSEVAEGANPINPQYTPDIPTFKDTPAYSYRSWLAVHELDDTLVVARVVLLPAAQSPKGLKAKLVAESVISTKALTNIPAFLERITLKALEDITV